MPKFNIFYDIEGPAGKLRGIPNKDQPVEAESLRQVLEELSENLPQPFGCRCFKVVVEEVQGA